MISLEQWSQQLRGYQEAVVADAFSHLREIGSEDPPTRTLYASPTGTGKGTIQLALLKELRALGVNAWIVTPSLEVLRGYVDRCGGNSAEVTSADALAHLGQQIYVTTPTRLQNRVLAGTRGMPSVVIVDEVHHAVETNSVSGTLFALAPNADWIGFTATPYRGTPKGCAQLRADWGEPIVVLTIPEAVEQGYMALPTFEVVPLVDDDQITFRNGRFVTRSASKIVSSRMEGIAGVVLQRLDGVPTAVTVPSSETAGALVEALGRLDVNASWIHQGTPAAERSAAYAACQAGDSVIVSIRVLSEGVDMPWLRRLIDARPMASPVAWVQQIGRIMRPGPRRPEYVCVCRNLERHAWLLQGGVPRSKVLEAQKAFEQPSKRTDSRAIGLEKLNRFKRIDVPLLGGLVGSAFALHSVDKETGVKTEWFCLLDPTSADVLYAQREVLPPAPGETRRARDAYGSWKLCPPPSEGFVGFATSSARGQLSDKQAAWWERSAARFGLEPRAVNGLTRRQFSVLPVLSDLGVKVEAPCD